MTSRRLSHPSPGRHPAGRPERLVLKTLPLAVALCFGSTVRADINPDTAGLPMGGTVAAGSVASNLVGNTLTITQTGNRAILDWTSFNIDSGKTLVFVQPGASAAVLNRVSASAGLSEIYGTLSANGMVLLMNPNGVLFGNGATVNVGSLIATTGTVNVSRFMDDVNDGVIAITGATGSVRNEGSITAHNAGLVALVAPSVLNQGSIVATGGRIALAGTDRATVTLNGGLFEFALPAGAIGTSVSNDAGASLEGAQLLMTTGDAADLVSGVINLAGMQQASSTLVVNGDVVLLQSALDAPSVSGSSNRIEVSPGARVHDAISIARTGSPGDGATVVLKAGDHAEQILLNKANLSLSGEAGARLLVPDAAEVNGITLSAANVTVENLEIVGPLNQPYYDYYATPRSNISRGIAVADGVTGFTLRNNNLHDLRTGILIHGRNSTGSVSGNRIENTKSGISVQYTDASGIAISGNSQGASGNEWGLNLHLNGHLVGGTIVSNSTPISTAPTPGWQQSLLDLSSANNGWTVQDQGYTASNRTHVQVAGSGAASHQGSRLTPIDTVQGGINAAVSGGTVKVAAGSYTQAATLNVNKPLTLLGAGEVATTLDARSITAGYGMLVTADDVTLRDFTFYGPSAFYASAYGIKVSPSGTADARLRNFTIMNVTSRGAGKAELDLNGVNGALIDHVTLNGAPVGNDAGSTQGAGLQLTDSANVTVRDSTTLNNAWGGLALYQANRSYNQQVNAISIAADNQFHEVNPVYLQDESALHDFGTLDIAGFDYAVRNAASTGSSQYTWLQAALQPAYDFAVNLPGAGASFIQGWDGAGATQDYAVGVGQLAGGGTQAMSIASALSQSGSGAQITIGAGSYNETVSLAGRRNLRFADATLQGLVFQVGAADSGIGGQVTATGAGGIRADAALQLLADTRLATTGADINLDGHISNAAGGSYSLSLVAGSGSNRGNVSMRSGGTESSPLEQFDVSANRYSLSDTLWVQRYQINALGLVALSDHTLRALDATGNSTLTTNGDVTGSTISLGNVAVQSSGDVSVSVSAGGDALVAGNNITGTIAGADVAVTAQGNANVDVVATQTATLAAESVSGSVSAPALVVDAGGSVQLELQTQTATVHADGPVILSGDSSSLSLDASGGSVSGNFGQVSNTGEGVVTVNGRPELSQNLAQNADNNRVLPGRSALSEGALPDTPSDRRPGPGSILAQLGEVQIARGSPAQAGGAIDRGQSVEIDLSPGHDKEPK
ncbi:filamentous hemagglutinin N-terminal domain-containing protein [Rhodoferax sp. BAB1]|uniref:two-partner secretion domain-containing protein n=1 Tax=Rhodoferax sp. BAB1 TaxID=2741720 RepID=UPI001575D518|nr:filamentous hemagglutinin N-terminal domain-containing protein [Rhodoferax sp. BAB1]QKO21613.1 filamentous hemagglutinin N-terminal domain-containing protein [Rhodoferax sp. BAB1]